MIISEKTKISEIIKANKKAIDVIASINPNFIKLKNPILRKLLASHVTVEQAARIGKTTSNTILNKLKEIDFEIEVTTGSSDIPDSIPSDGRKVDERLLKTLDVRAMIASGTDPFSIIMKEVKQLPEGYTLLIINTFEPIPLINLLSKKGFDSWTEVVNEQLYKTYFKPGINSVAADTETDINLTENEFEALLKKYEGRFTELDVRGMEMPYPMITILNALPELPEGQALLVHHFKIPQLLLPQLDTQNCKYSIKNISDDYIQMIIYKLKI